MTCTRCGGDDDTDSGLCRACWSADFPPDTEIDFDVDGDEDSECQCGAFPDGLHDINCGSL